MRALVVFLGLFVNLTLLILSILTNNWWVAIVAAFCLVVVFLNIQFRVKWGFWP